MAVFKRRRKIKLPNGKTVVRQSAKWHIKYRDADGIVRCVPASTDKVASQQLEARLLKEVELAKVGIFNPHEKQQAKLLTEHLAEFKQSLLDKGVTSKQAKLTHNRIKSVFDCCQFKMISDIQASKLQSYLADRRREGLSVRSSNFYLKAVKQFCRWLVADNRTKANPVEYLQTLNPKNDVRRERRALELDGIKALLAKTEQSQKHHRLTGKERTLLYTLALNTGFRAKELASLKWNQFDLNDTAPTVTVLSAYTKNRKETVMPLRQDIASKFREWFADNRFAQNAKIFRWNPNRAAEMLKRDLEAAGICFEDDAGRVLDFHALRHTFITGVAQSGATPKEIQTLARHSTVELSLGVYTHLTISDERRALEKLPQMTGEAQASMLKTGTDDKPVGANLTPDLTPNLIPTAYSACNGLEAVGTGERVVPENNKHGRGVDKSLSKGRLGTKKTPLSAIDNGVKKAEEEGFEPPVPCGTAVFKTATLSHSVTPPTYRHHSLPEQLL